MKHMKRFLGLVLSLVLVLGMMPVLTHAAVYEGTLNVNGSLTHFDRIEDAIAAASQIDGSIVTLGMPAEVENPIVISSGNFTIDLMGYDIACTNSEEGNVLYVDGANLTIRDTSVRQSGSLTPCGANVSDSAVWVASGEVTIDGFNMKSYYCAVTVSGGKVTINNINTNQEIHARGGEIIINGGYMEQLRASGGTITVNGGHFTTTGVTYVLYLNGGDIVVNGGTFNTPKNYTIRYNNARSTITLQGGSFVKGIWISALYATGIDATLYDSLTMGYNFYDAAGEWMDVAYDADEIIGYTTIAESSPGPRTYHVKLDLEALESSNTSSTLQSGHSYITNLIPSSGYMAPSSITVKMDGSTVSSSNYTYNNGFLMITSANITGDIEIIARGVEKRYYFAQGTISSGTGDFMTENGTVWSKTYSDVQPGTQYEAYVTGITSKDSITSESVFYNVDTPCDVTISYDTATEVLSVTGDGVSPYIPPTYTLYYDNYNTKWDNVYIYSWSGDGDWATKYAGNWPGTKMELVEGETDIYVYTLPIEAEKVIFNNGNGVQTIDLTIPTTSETMYDHSTGTWSTYTPVCKHPSHDQNGVCADCGETVEHTFDNGTCTVCGLVILPTLTPILPTVALEEEVKYNFYFTASNLGDRTVNDMGLAVFTTKDENGTVDTAAEVIPEAIQNGEYYMVQSNGIPAKEMGDELYFRIYVQLADGTYVYSEILSFSAVDYVKSVLEKSDDEGLKKTCVALMNYGASAQTYFGYKADALMNSFLTDDQRAMVNAYDASMVSPIVKADSGKVGEFTATADSFTKRVPSVSLEGAFAINYYFKPAKTVDGEMTFYYWDKDTYNSVDVLTKENALGSKVMSSNSANEYWAAFDGIAAKELDDTMYVAGVYESDGVTYCTGVLAVSISALCQTHMGSDANLTALTESMVVYGNCAKAYFGN